jgi:hypothetical protein
MNLFSTITLIFIIIIFIGIVKNFSNFSKFSSYETILADKLYNGTKWNKYRIGDVFMMDPTGDYYKPGFYDSVLYHETMYPGTIAYEYMKRNKQFMKKQNLQLLKQIIMEQQNKYNDVLENTLVLHIRVGDVLCTYKEKKVFNNKYTKKGDTVWWNSVIDYIKENDITEVVIIAGTHFKECLEESANYILDRSKFLKSYGLKVSYRLGQSPDDDILFCQNAKHFITTGGGYGNLLDMLLKDTDL